MVVRLGAEGARRSKRKNPLAHRPPTLHPLTQRFILQLKATLENVASITIPPGYDFCVDVKDAAGDTARDRVTFSAAEEHELPGSRGVAHFAIKWDRGAKHAASITIEGVDIKNVTRPYTADDSDSWGGALAAVEARGIDMTGFHPGPGFRVVAASGAVFDDVDLSDDWCEFDEKAGESVGVYGCEGRWEVRRG